MPVDFKGKAYSTVTERLDRMHKDTKGKYDLFTEVIGQAAFFINNGYFPEQKIAILPGFDYFNIGVIEGYDIINKELVAK